MGSLALRHLVLVRHGETAGESSIRYHGANDVALNEHGRDQMRCVATALAAESFDAVFTSTRRRTLEAATLITPAISPMPIAAFDEINFGDWEGLTGEEIEARDPALYRQWRDDPSHFTYPGGDCVPTFRERVVDAFRQLLPAAPERVLIVAHKGVIASVLGEILKLSVADRAAWPIDLASIHAVARRPEGWQTQLANYTRHLQDDVGELELTIGSDVAGER